MKSFEIIVAVDTFNGIGKKGYLPWGNKLSLDLKNFRIVTTACSSNKINAIIMGKHTWESIPLSKRPLVNRLNIIISSNIVKGELVFNTFEDALIYLNNINIDKVFVIGGGQLYREALSKPYINLCNGIHLTKVFYDFSCDTFFPNIDLGSFEEHTLTNREQENGISFQLFKYMKKI